MIRLDPLQLVVIASMTPGTPRSTRVTGRVIYHTRYTSNLTSGKQQNL